MVEIMTIFGRKNVLTKIAQGGDLKTEIAQEPQEPQNRNCTEALGTSKPKLHKGVEELLPWEPPQLYVYFDFEVKIAQCAGDGGT